MPYLPVLGVVIALIAAWVRFDPNAQLPAPKGAERYTAPSDVAIATFAVATFLGGVGAMFWMSGRWPAALGLWALACGIGSPWATVRAVWVPLGWPRAAAWGAYWSNRAWRRDARGGALVAGTLAAMKRGGPDPDTREWLTARFGAGVFADEPEERFGVSLGAGGIFQSASTEAQAPLLPGGAVAVGLTDAAVGDVDVARGILEALPQFDPRLRPLPAEQIASRWLAADAIARGDWASLVPTAPVATDAAGGLARLVARRVAGPPEAAPSGPALWLALVATGRPALAGLVRFAESAKPVAAGPAEVPSEGLSAALTAHVRLLEDPHAERLRAAARAWDAARLDGALASRIVARAAALGCSAAARDRVLAAAEEDLAALVVANDLDVGVIEGPTLEAASRSIRERAISDTEALAEGLGRRVGAKRWANGADELREWVGVKLAYERACRLGGEPVRRLLFGPVHRAVCAQAVWLWNERGQKPLGNAIFRWLLEEATALSVEDLVRLQTKNVACGP